ncbi:hypothetical protein Taro_040800 [Colocasia esculenta]|uniref:Uncharacterized protein n=1 Tax=Colocasia esculenta TaxID=4460 RepID=A0A843WRG9_COLES|nr:hypothetical protein [Colocasia esculenta]
MMAQHTTLSSTTHKLSTMAQTTTGARRLQIEHDSSNHTMLELRSLDGIRWRFSSIDDTLLLWHLKCQKSFFDCSSSVGSAPFPNTANFSPEIPLDSHILPLERMACSFWRWS